MICGRTRHGAVPIAEGSTPLKTLSDVTTLD